jgi:hypothetical protein
MLYMCLCPLILTTLLLSLSADTYKKTNHSSNVSFRKHSSGDYLLFHSPLATYDWSSVYNETSVDRLIVAIIQHFKQLSLLCVLRSVNFLYDFLRI